MENWDLSQAKNSTGRTDEEEKNTILWTDTYWNLTATSWFKQVDVFRGSQKTGKESAENNRSYAEERKKEASGRMKKYWQEFKAKKMKQKLSSVSRNKKNILILAKQHLNVGEDTQLSLLFK